MQRNYPPDLPHALTQLTCCSPPSQTEWIKRWWKYSEGSQGKFAHMWCNQKTWFSKYAACMR